MVPTPGFFIDTEQGPAPRNVIMKGYGRIAFGLFFCLILVSACSQPPEPVEISGVLELEATVVAVDADKRSIELEGPDGNRIATRVGPDVRNLAQVKVGDKLNVSYYSGYVLSMAEPGVAGSEAEAFAGRAAEGERPAATIGTTQQATVEILSVSTDGKKVSFRDGDGRTHSIPVRREEARAFAKRLKPGDMVDIHYSDALTVSIEPTGSGG